MKNNELTEAQFVDKLVLNFEKYFKVDREVWSECRNGRIDLILTTKEGYRFGIECKRPDEKRGEEIGEFIKQSLRYSDYIFNGNKIPIFIAPPISYSYFIMNEMCKEEDGVLWHKDRHKESDSHHTCNGLLGALGIGEMRKSQNYFYFAFSNKTIWTSQREWNTTTPKGIHEENYNKLLKKLGI